MNKQQGKNYGNDLLNAHKSDNYQAEYDPALVSKWDELIDWESRAKAEGGFFVDKLHEYGVRKVLDVATGTGFHSVRLIESGFEVTSVDGSPAMLAKAFENACRRGHILRAILSDWRWLTRDVHERYDAVVCLGNSFTHLQDEDDRRKALAEYYAVLQHDGILILDQRNYDAILDREVEPNHNYYYCGKNVKIAPEYVADSLARFRYEFSGGKTFHLNMFPLRKSYAERLLKEAGFKHVSTYGDFKEIYRNEEPGFFIHIAEKAHGARSGDKQ